MDAQLYALPRLNYDLKALAPHISEAQHVDSNYSSFLKWGRF
jgi:hypothetical protein